MPQITPLVIHSGGRTHTHILTSRTEVILRNQARAGRSAPGLKRKGMLNIRILSMDELAFCLDKTQAKLTQHPNAAVKRFP